MKKFFIIVALFAFVLANAVYATDIDVTFEVNWGENVNAYDVAPTCILYDSNWDQVTSLPLTCQDAGYSQYTVTFEDPSASCHNYGFTWDTGEDIDWEDPPALTTGTDIWDGIEVGSDANEAE